MGWGSGGEFAANIWDVVRPHIPIQKRKEVSGKIIDLFERMDCDTLQEAEELMNDAECWYCVDCGERILEPGLCGDCFDE